MEERKHSEHCCYLRTLPNCTPIINLQSPSSESTLHCPGCHPADGCQQYSCLGSQSDQCEAVSVAEGCRSHGGGKSFLSAGLLIPSPYFLVAVHQGDHGVMLISKGTEPSPMSNFLMSFAECHIQLPSEAHCEVTSSKFCDILLDPVPTNPTHPEGLVLSKYHLAHCFQFASPQL